MAMTIESPASAIDAEILGRIISHTRGEMPAEIAEIILQWDFSEFDQKQIADLSEKARRGLLSPQEEAVLDSYVRVGHLVNLLQAKARGSLKQRPQE